MHRATSSLRAEIFSRNPFRVQNLRRASCLSTSSRANIPITPSQVPSYNYIEGVERTFGYGPGGYHPIGIGDTLHQRYRVVDKLGWGGCSTIWLARDTTLSKYVSVKVGVAASDDKEVEILSRLSNPMPGSDDRGKSLFRPILDRFSLNGPNGTHPCSVATVARCSLSYLEQDEDRGVHDLSVVRSLAAQLAIAVGYMHKQGFVHGDLHLGNVLLQLPQSFDNMSDQQIYDRFGMPDPIAVYRIDGGPLPSGVPSHVFEPQPSGVTGSNITLPESRILLADLGRAFCPALESRLESYTTVGLRPPEARFEPTTSLSFASDIWGLACAIWHIAGREPVFEHLLFDEDDVATGQVDRLGPMPPEWWEKWETRSQHFHQDGTPVPIRTPITWKQRFEETIQQPRRDEGMGAFDQSESQAFQEMLRGMLVYRPGERLTADQVLNTRWMREWAIPEWEKIEK